MIKWALGLCRTLWGYADVVEVIDLGKALEASPSHVKRSANSEVEQLAKECIVLWLIKERFLLSSI